LIERGVTFKAPRSLIEVQKINSGVAYPYSQVGKVFTVYPKNDKEAVILAQQLHQLTRRFSAPSIPFDLPFADAGNVYYRFGPFRRVELDRAGDKVLATYGANGDLVPDKREEPKPDWVIDPFERHRPLSRRKTSPPRELIRVFRALTQRGKGGVYEAIDFTGHTPQLCLLKEGRKHGEINWDGRDGAWRVRNEARVLARLAQAGVRVPAVRSSFEQGGNYYLVMEHLDSETLHRVLYRLRRRLPLTRALDYSLQLATFISQMHRAGWVWRDCKPNNIIVTREGRLVPIDFEGAACINQPDYVPWGTPGFTPPEWRDRKAPSHQADDLYALGAMIYLLLTGRIFESDNPVPIEKLRRNVPGELRKLTQSLLVSGRTQRPSAENARRILNTILRRLGAKRTRLTDTKAA
jgi:serine/threonine protein kinase